MNGISSNELSDLFSEIAEKLKQVAERFKELYEQLKDCDTEIYEQQKFKPCLRIGVLRPFLSNTRKLWQKNKALYLCPYMSKSSRHKNTKSRRASNELF